MADRTIEEICTVGELMAYRKEVEMAVELARHYGFTVAGRYDRSNACVLRGAEINFIRIPLGEAAQKGLPLLWSMLHEIGHVIDGAPCQLDLSLEERIPREHRAWDNAWELVEKHIPSMIGFREHFKAYRDKCLSSYSQAIRAKQVDS